MKKRKTDSNINGGANAAPAPITNTKPTRDVPPGFWDWPRLKANVPLGERTLRSAIKDGLLPCIRLGGKGRRLLFHPESVSKSILRFQRGGVTE